MDNFDCCTIKNTYFIVDWLKLNWQLLLSFDYTCPRLIFAICGKSLVWAKRESDSTKFHCRLGFPFPLRKVKSMCWIFIYPINGPDSITLSKLPCVSSNTCISLSLWCYTLACPKKTIIIILIQKLKADFFLFWKLKLNQSQKLEYSFNKVAWPFLRWWIHFGFHRKHHFCNSFFFF